MRFLQSWRIRKPEADSESVYISEKFGVRTLHIGSDTVQSAMRVGRPYDLEIAYTRSMMAFLLFNADPREVLMIGLGGGSLAKFIYHQLPQARTVAVEVNPRVVTIARQFFSVPVDDERLQVIVGDGSAFVHTHKRRPDVIIVDGYDSESQVEELSTVAFYRDCARVLDQAGVFVVNLWGGDRNYTTCVSRISDAFGGHIACLPAGRPGNIVALAFKRTPAALQWDELRRRADALALAHGLEFPEFVKQLAVLNRNDAQRLFI
jgi:spermidine synthase